MNKPLMLELLPSTVEHHPHATVLSHRRVAARRPLAEVPRDVTDWVGGTAVDFGFLARRTWLGVHEYNSPVDAETHVVAYLSEHVAKTARQHGQYASITHVKRFANEISQATKCPPGTGLLAAQAFWAGVLSVHRPIEQFCTKLELVLREPVYVPLFVDSGELTEPLRQLELTKALSAVRRAARDIADHGAITDWLTAWSKQRHFDSDRRDADGELTEGVLARVLRNRKPLPPSVWRDTAILDDGIKPLIYLLPL